MASVSTDFLQTPLQYLKGVGPKRAADLQRVGLSTVEDLLYRFPLRYEDRGHLRPISSLKAGEEVAIAGRIQSSRLRTTRRPGFRIFEALVGDASGSIVAVWMNQPYLQDILRRDAHVVLFGAVEARPRPAAHQSRVRGHRHGRYRWRGIGRCADRPHRPHRAGLRKGRGDDAEDAASARLRPHRTDAGRSRRSVSRRGAPARSICPIAARRSWRRISRRRALRATC